MQVDLNTLGKNVAFAKKNRLIQLVTQPVLILKYLLLTRIAFFLKMPIRGEALMFNGLKITGYFPEPVFSYIYLYGFLEDDLTSVILQYLKPGMTFVDVGSYIGDFAVVASKIVGKNGRVYAFEPTPSTYRLLKTNTSKLSNVKIENIALWHKREVLEFSDYGKFYSGCNSFNEARMPDSILKRLTPKKIKMTTLTLDQYCQVQSVKPDLIKIDAEGSEFNVLIGAKNIISKYKPIITIETGDKSINPPKGTRDCLRLLDKYGYFAYDINGGRIHRHKLRDNYLFKCENLIFLPKHD